MSAIRLLLIVLSVTCLRADTVLQTPEDSKLREAVAAGGLIQFRFNGTVFLTNQIEVLKPTVLNATGYQVIFNGGGKRIFRISSTSLKSTNIVFQSGANSGTPGSLSSSNGVVNGTGAFGGAIIAQGSELLFERCAFINNGVSGADALVLGGGYPTRSVGGTSASGGALYLEKCNAIFKNCTFAYNTAAGGSGTSYVDYPPFALPYYVEVGGGGGEGGAIYGRDSFLLFRSTVFSNNVATTGVFGGDYGGAIDLERGGLEADLCIFIENSAIGGRANAGGAIRMNGTGSVSRCVFFRNLVQTRADGARGDLLGGAVWCSGTNMFSACSFGFNSSFGVGGGIDIARGGGIHVEGAFGLVNCTFAGNSITGGYGAWQSQGRWSEFVPGEAYGGAIFCRNATGSVQFTTVVSNSASLKGPFGFSPAKLGGGGGIACNTNTISLQGVIFDSNLYTNSNQNIFGQPFDLGGNISSDNSFAFQTTNSLTGVEPGLANTLSLDAFNYFFPPKTSSPAIDLVPIDSVTVDQLGATRPFGRAADAGAIEYQGQEIMVRFAPVSGIFRLNVLNSTYRPLIVSKSQDLLTWIPVLTNVSPVLEIPANDAAAFFRAKNQ